MTVFDRAWFDRHQRSLVAALNTPGLGRELRAALGIDDRRARMVRVLPHASIVAVDPILRVAEFRSRPFIARRLRAEFLPIWKLMHWFDMRVANPLVPALNMGFDTLTKYPDAHPETDTVDGYVGRLGVDETFPTIIAGAGLSGVISNGVDEYLYLAATTTTDQYSQIRRLFFLFDTSALTSPAVITGATFSVWGIAKQNDLGETPMTLVSSNPAANNDLVITDYTTLGSTSFGSVAYSAFDGTNSVYTDVTVNGSGLAAISKTSITKYGARFEWDRAGTFSGTWSSGQINYFRMNMAENAAGQARAPKLTVTFAVGNDARVVIRKS